MNNTLKRFFKSKLYVNFWIFSLKGALTVGVSSLIGVCLSSLIASESTGHSDFVMFGVFIFFIGLAIGLVASAASFWIVYGISRVKTRLRLEYVGLAAGGLIGLAVIGQLYRQGLAMTPIGLQLAFPIGPLLVSVAIYVKLVKQHLDKAATSLDRFTDPEEQYDRASM